MSQGLEYFENQPSDKHISISAFSIQGPRNSKKLASGISKYVRVKLRAEKKHKINIENFKINIFEPGLENAKNELRDRLSEISK